MKHPDERVRFWQIVGGSLGLIGLVCILASISLIHSNYSLLEANAELASSYNDAYAELQQLKSGIGYGCVARVPGELVMRDGNGCRRFR